MFHSKHRFEKLPLSEQILRQARNVGLVFSKVSVDYSGGLIKFTNYPSDVYVKDKQLFDQKFFIRARTVVASCLPRKFHLKVQIVPLLNANNELIILFEKNDSKQLMEREVHLKYYRIPLMEDTTWNIATQPHALITGVTGSGKSYVINYLFSCFLKLNAEIFIIDPKISDLASIGNSYLPSTNCATGADAAIEVLEKLNSIMEDRQKDIIAFDDYGSDAYKLHFRPIVLFFDELAALAAEISSDKKKKAQYDLLLKKLILKGRSAGITMVLTMQKPLSANLPTEIRDQCSLRIVLGKNTPKDTRKLVFGITESQITITDTDNIVYDEWLESQVPNFGGWYSLPSMNEPFQVFESPELSDFDFSKEIIRPLKASYF